MEEFDGYEETRLFGDVLLLPIDGFVTGVPHSGASESKVEASLVKHQISGAWKGGVD
jgi:alpha 1,6-mannosyltransferase